MSAPSYLQLKITIEKLASLLLNGRIQKVKRRVFGGWVLECYSQRQTYRLLLSVEQPFPRLSLLDEGVETQPVQTSAGEWLRAHLKNHRIQSITLDERQRLVTLSTPQSTLKIELFGAVNRLIGVGVDGVVAMVYPKSTLTRLEIGLHYQKPDDSRAQSGVHRKQTLTWEEYEIETSRLEAKFFEEQTQARKRNLVSGAVRRLKRLEKNLMGDLKKLGDPELLKRQGELLKTVMGKVKRGMTQIEVVDYFDAQMPTVTIELDAKMDAAENIARLFKRYRKGQSGLSKVRERLAVTEEDLRFLEALTIDELSYDALRERLKAKKLFSPRQERRLQKRTATRRPYLTYMSSSGHRILVGRGGKDNHETTFSVGRGNDYWFHVKDAPGAHVLVPASRNVVVDEETFQDAASLAIHYSKLRGERGAVVTQTQRKYVRPIPGAAPGRVSVSHERTREVWDLDSRLLKLFESKPQSVD